MMTRDRTVASFSRNMRRVIGQHNELLLAIHNKRNEASLSNELVAQTALSLTVLWENFVNDLLLCYVSTNPSRALQSLESRILQSVESRYGKACARHVICDFPKKPSPRAIAAMIDEKGMNITAKTATELATKANDLISGTYAKRFTLDQRDAQFYDFIIALRNYLGHTSHRSRQILHDMAGRMQHADNSVYLGHLFPIGPYLKSNTALNKHRIVLIAQRLNDIAERL